MTYITKYLPVAGLIGLALYDASVGNYSGALAQVVAAAGLLGLHFGKADAVRD